MEHWVCNARGHKQQGTYELKEKKLGTRGIRSNEQMGEEVPEDSCRRNKWKIWTGNNESWFHGVELYRGKGMQQVMDAVLKKTIDQTHADMEKWT